MIPLAPLSIYAPFTVGRHLRRMIGKVRRFGADGASATAIQHGLIGGGVDVVDAPGIGLNTRLATIDHSLTCDRRRS